jgi:carboxyl-terminal processing protease
MTLRTPLFAAVCLLTSGTTMAAADEPVVTREAEFEEAWRTINAEFFDPQFRGTNWNRTRSVYRDRALAAIGDDEFAGVMNEMLGTLKSSHTAYFGLNDPRRQQILGVFQFLAKDEQVDLLEYEHIGVAVRREDGRVFAASVYDGLPAAAAGLKYGDEIISVDGLPWEELRSFRGKAGQSAAVVIRRHPEQPQIQLTVPVERLNGRTMFERAMDASVRRFERGQRTIGYVHLWSYAGQKYQDKLEELLLGGELAKCDALVLDLRDGWGGASPDYLNLFRTPILNVESRTREGTRLDFGTTWTKPVALLVNGQSTSGKELFTAAFKKLKRGPVIGETTAGAVLAGRPYLLASGAVLYVAVVDLTVDGRRLEGVGVSPTIAIQRPLQFADGADPQLDCALKVLSASH